MTAGAERLLRLVLQVKGRGDMRVLIPGVRKPISAFLVKAILSTDVLWVPPTASPTAPPETPYLISRVLTPTTSSSPVAWDGRPAFLGAATRLGLLAKGVAALEAQGMDSSTFEAASLR